VLLDQLDLQRPRMSEAQGDIWCGAWVPAIDEIVHDETHGEEWADTHLAPPFHGILAIVHDHAKLTNPAKKYAHSFAPELGLIR
jgi:hypothetical protein